MDKRIELHALLVAILGSNNVYFQPPSNLLMQYPCIVYGRVDVEQKFADDITYSQKRKYTVILIDSDPDSEVLDNILSMPLTGFDRHYTVDGLNHDVFTTYY